MYSEKTDKGLYTCPNNHLYNANKYGDTCPNCGAKQQDKKKNQDEYEKELKLEPDAWACGFLVCIEGINKGRVYVIKDGKNFVGSDPNMDIWIQGDLAVEPQNHAVIMYDSKGRTTNLLAGSSKGMVYIADKAIYEPTELGNYTVLEIGKSQFIFIEFCSTNFDWDDMENN